jgi:hypothetical protein
MTTRVGKAEVTSERGKRVQAKLATRSNSSSYEKLSGTKKALETKFNRLSKETRNGSVRVLTNV